MEGLGKPPSSGVFPGGSAVPPHPSTPVTCRLRATKIADRHACDELAAQYGQLFVLIELRPVPCDDTCKRSLFGYQVDHPVWRRDPRQSRIEVVQMDVLYTRVETLDVKDGLREVLIK